MECLLPLRAAGPGTTGSCEVLKCLERVEGPQTLEHLQYLEALVR